MVACIDFFEMSEICRPKFIVRHSISAATRAGLVIVEMKENIFRNILDIAKKLELHVGFEQQIKHSGSSERQKTKL
jgi:hypothetical protein